MLRLPAAAAARALCRPLVKLHGGGGPSGRQGIHVGCITIMENQMEKKMENEMEPGIIQGIIGIRVSQN